MAVDMEPPGTENCFRQESSDPGGSCHPGIGSSLRVLTVPELIHTFAVGAGGPALIGGKLTRPADVGEGAPTAAAPVSIPDSPTT